MIAKRLLPLLVFIGLLFTVLIGLAIGIGYMLPVSSQMIYTKPFDNTDIRTVSILLRDTSRNIDQRLTREQGINELAEWSPDGQQIAYFSFTHEQVFRLYLMDALGRNKRRVSLEFENLDSSPHWSPDGNWILMSGSTQGLYKTVLFNIATEQSYVIHTYAPDRMQWSPDSQNILYLANSEDGLAHLYGLNIACLSAVESCQFPELDLFPNGGVYSEPVWSPDGKFLAFSKYEDDKTKIAVARLRCSALTARCVDGIQVIADMSTLDSSPIWSPDSKQLAFVDGRSQLNFYQIESAKIRSVTLPGNYTYLKYWSPDGRFVAFLSEHGGMGNSYMMDVTSGEWHSLLPDQVTSEFPIWRPIPR